MSRRKPNKNITVRERISNLFLSLREFFVWIMVLLLSVFFIISLIGYSPEDRGMTYTGTSQVVNNIAGAFGASIADFFLAVFGRTAYLLFAVLISVSWRRLRRPELFNRSTGHFVLITSSFLAVIVSSSGLEHIYFISNYPFESGGALGQYFSSLLVNVLGLLGVTLLFLGLFIAGITIIMRIPWLHWMDVIGYCIYIMASKLAKICNMIFTAYRSTVPSGGRQRVRKSLGLFSTLNRQKEVAESVIKNKTNNIISRSLSEKKQQRIAPMLGDAKADTCNQPEQQNLLVENDSEDVLPALSLLDGVQEGPLGYSAEELQVMSHLLVKKLGDFNVDVTVEAVHPGPVITRFEIEPAPGIKASQISGLSRDLARSLSVVSVRVVENIPGKTCIGIEIPNQSREIVRLVEGLSSAEYIDNASPLSLVLGKDIAGNTVVTDLIKMPHVLIAGTTGSGKSVCINALILSLIYKSSPEEVRMIMVDPKFLELSVYDGIPHLLTPVVTDMSKAANALRWCVLEMDRRFRLMAELSVRSITGFNKKIQTAQKMGTPAFDPAEEVEEGEQREELSTLPYIVVIVDELADLMMVAGKKIEEVIIRIAQRARAAGIHLVLATQRPSVDVVTGLIKANVPARIAFQVSSRADSRTVIDQMGAEQLLGQGDMLFLPPGTGTLQRVHGSLVSDEEVAKVVANVKQTGRPDYREEILSGDVNNEASLLEASDGDGESDPLYDEAVAFVIQSRKASISAIQRALRVGYNRAARMIDTMEQSGVVSTTQSGRREVLIPSSVED